LESAENEIRKQQHDACHYLAWKGGSKDLEFNIYRHEVCNTSIFKMNKVLTCSTPQIDTRIRGTDFAKSFLDGQRSIALEEFEDYLKWLMTKTSRTKGATLELAAVNPDEEVYSMEEFESVRAANEWMSAQKELFRSKYGNGGQPSRKKRRTK
jgi:hypothetical protein